MPINQNSAIANTAKNGIRQPIAVLGEEETWRDSLGLAGLYATSIKDPGIGLVAKDTSDSPANKVPCGSVNW